MIIIIPARRGSTRLPGKMLVDIHGEPLIWHVANRAKQAGRVIVATDDWNIGKASGCEHVLTSDCRTGSDRVAQAIGIMGIPDGEIVVNVQGDEYGMDPDRIIQCAELTQVTYSWATLGENQPDGVRVVRDGSLKALYFTRHQIPASLRHVGIYAAPAGHFRRFSNAPQSEAELAESLEQLRLLHMHEHITVGTAVGRSGVSIDTPGDLKRLDLWDRP